MKTLITTLVKHFCVFFIFVFFVHFTANAQPKERLKNRYIEPNMSYGAPYTMFEFGFS
jgi:hypothetical protein